MKGAGTDTFMDSGFNVDFLEPMQGAGFRLPNIIDDAPIQGRNFDLMIPSFRLTPDYSGGPGTDEDANFTNLFPESTVSGVNFMSLPGETHADSWGHSTPVRNSSVAINGATAVSQETRDARSLPISTQIAQQLAELSIDLGKHAATIPPLSIHDSRDAYATFLETIETTGDESTTKTQGKPVFSLKRTFQLTQTLINLYPRLTKTNIRISTPNRSFNFNATSSAAVEDNSRSTRNPTASSTSRDILDHALVLQLLSCHHRVTDTWDLIFSHVYKGIETGKFRPSLGEDCPCHKLRIGNFIPTTKVPLEIVLSLEFFKQLLSQAQQLVEHISSMQHIDERTVNVSVMEDGIPITSDPNTEATNNAGLAVINKADDLVRKACHIRSLIENQNSSDI